MSMIAHRGSEILLQDGRGLLGTLVHRGNGFLVDLADLHAHGLRFTHVSGFVRMTL